MGRTLQPEDRISHYRVVGPLGAGGMGEVYIARDESLERSVALKTLPPGLVRNEERVRRFVTEAKSASSLNHPNIVTIYEIGHDEVKPAGSGARRAEGGKEGAAVEPKGQADPRSGPVHFIAMELVAGDTLTQKIHHEKTDVRTLLGYLAQAAEGVAKAHAAGIVHRDLKPGNIMVSRDGFTKVLDFGLAKLTEKQPAAAEPVTNLPTEAAATGEGVMMGTVGYMSPEQVQGKPADHRSDIFSMGCVLYEAATRRRPFVADTGVEVMHKILRERPAPVEEINPEVPSEVRRLIRRCLAKNPEERLQSMRDLAIELREIAGEYDSLALATATSAGSTMTARALPPALRGGTMAVLAGVALLGLGGLAVGLYSLMGRGGSPPATDGGFQQTSLSVLMSRDDLAEAVLSRDGRYLAYVARAETKTSLNVRQVRTGSDVQILPPQDFQIRGISFSPDGDYLHFLNQDPAHPNYSALFQVASLGGAPRKLVFDVDTAATFSPDGKRLCFRRGIPQERADSLVVFDLETGQERQLIRVVDPETFSTFTGADTISGAPAWSPDGRRIAVPVYSSVGGVRAHIALIDAADGARQDVGSRPFAFIESLGWLPGGDGIMANAFMLGSFGFQIYRVSIPDGGLRRMTNDLDGYEGLSMSTADGGSVAAIRRIVVNNIWVGAPSPPAEPQAITFASGSSASVELIDPLADGGIAFTAPRGNAVYLWRIEPDGSGRRQLTTQGIYVLNVRVAGKTSIVFTQIEKEGIGHVWRIDPDGGGLRQMTQGQGEEMLAVSPDGGRVLFTRWENRHQIWSQDLAGGEPKLLASDASTGNVRFSPDGTRISYSVLEEVGGRIRARVLIVPASGGPTQASLVVPPGALDSVWTPDGLAFSYIDRDKGYNLMRQPIAGGPPEQLTKFDSGRMDDHEWSPDGSRICLRRATGRQHSLWILERGQREARQVAEFRTGDIRTVRWSADSTRLIFTYGTSSEDVILMSNLE